MPIPATVQPNFRRVNVIRIRRYPHRPRPGGCPSSPSVRTNLHWIRPRRTSRSLEADHGRHPCDASVPEVNCCVHHVITVSPTIAEVYLPESQVVPFRTIMADYILQDVALSAADISHRLGACRCGYFKHLRKAALEGLPHDAQLELIQRAEDDPDKGSRHVTIVRSARYDRDCLLKGRRQ